jgi:hypothetical protein
MHFLPCVTMPQHLRFLTGIYESAVPPGWILRTHISWHANVDLGVPHGSAAWAMFIIIRMEHAAFSFFESRF